MDFQKSINIKTTSEKAFNAVATGIDLWWGNVDNTSVQNPGDEFSVFFEENTEWRFKILKLDKYYQVIWKCIYANHSFNGLKNIKDEWLNSEISFAFKKIADNLVKLTFKHRGLTPNLNCYTICDAGWTHFISNSLKLYLETGTGKPNLLEK